MTEKGERAVGFGKEFMWGAASAAYQVEGAFDEDGKGLGIWDALSDGHVKHGENGNCACDHYHRYKEDIALMKKMGLKAYRFSVSWPRIMPEEGVVSEKGIRFYQNLVEELETAGIEPLCTLFHWNLPMWLHEKGGWKHKGIENYFAEYVRIVVQALSNKVSWWMTFNEPACFVTLGYFAGIHAPFEKNQQAEQLAPVLVKNVLLSHGKAVQVIRKEAIRTPRIGIALNAKVYTPPEETEKEIRRAESETFSEKNQMFGYNLWADPMIKGESVSMIKEKIDEQEMQMICQPLDFLGFNSYNSDNYEQGSIFADHAYPGLPRTSMGWPITPDVLYWSIRYLYDRYQIPILVTENGMANLDFVMEDEKVHDPQRISFMKQYLKGVKRAAEEGFPVLGYMYWSLLDNFEWAEGYDKRFGLIYVDYRTQERTLKDSAYWYADVIKNNGEQL